MSSSLISYSSRCSHLLLLLDYCDSLLYQRGEVRRTSKLDSWGDLIVNIQHIKKSITFSLQPRMFQKPCVETAIVKKDVQAHSLIVLYIMPLNLNICIS